MYMCTYMFVHVLCLCVKRQILLFVLRRELSKLTCLGYTCIYMYMYIADVLRNI